MKMSEYTRGQWKKMKGKPFKERLAYFWDYYKWPTLIALMLVAALIYTVTVKLNEKETVLTGVMIDASTPLEDPAFLQEFCEAEGIDTKQQEINLQTGLSLSSGNPSFSITSYQRIHAGIAAKETDFLVGGTDAIRQCAYDSSNMLVDLREILTPEQLQRLDGRLYYIDGSLFETIYNGSGEMVEFPSPTAPENMKDPIPVAVHIRDCGDFLDSYYPEQPVYFAVSCTAPHLQTTIEFLDFIIEHTNKE